MADASYNFGPANMDGAPALNSGVPHSSQNLYNNNVNLNKPTFQSSPAASKVNTTPAEYTQPANSYKPDTSSQNKADYSAMNRPILESTDDDDTSEDVETPDVDSSNTADYTDNTPSVSQETVMKTIKKSSNLVEALESVAAMYCVPSTHIMCDNSLKSIKVVGDCVSAPAVKNVTGNAKAIICAIGAVLDNISQRIDDKINAWNIHTIMSAKNSNATDDCKGQIADTSTFDICKADVNQYFNDMDDITKDMDLNIIEDKISKDNIIDIPKSINESALLVKMYSDNDCSRNLGYDVMHKCGFDYVKHIADTGYNIYIEESAKTESDKTVSIEDIKYLKFDNTNIIKAINFFNKARAEQPVSAGHVDIKKFMESENYGKAIECLNKQFNASIQLKFFKFDDEGTNFYTSIWNDVKSHVTLSKTKGFQLNNLAISIFCYNNGFDIDAPSDISLFGQSLTGVILHEIFHNIAAVFKSQSTSYQTALTTTLAVASKLNAKNKRIMFTNYVNSINEALDCKLNKHNRKAMVKQLSVLSSVMYNNKEVEMLKKSISESTDEKEIDQLIKYYENTVTKLTKMRKSVTAKSIILGIVGATMIIGATLLKSLGKKIDVNIEDIISTKLIYFIGGCLSFSTIMKPFNAANYRAADKRYKNSTEMEEYYCDLFASMYNLPVTFLYGMRYNSSRGKTGNDISTEKFTKLISLERELYTLSFSKYPTTFERNHAAVKVAKNVLDSDTVIDPSIKKYLQWIVDNYSSTLNTDIDEIYNNTTFDPKEAEDLDTHLANLANSNSVELTESYITSILISDNYVSD